MYEKGILREIGIDVFPKKIKALLHLKKVSLKKESDFLRQKSGTLVNVKMIRQLLHDTFNIIFDFSDEIKTLLRHPSTELIMMIKDFNPVLLEAGDMYEAWLDICCRYAAECDVPLREWIEEKPVFQFSK